MRVIGCVDLSPILDFASLQGKWHAEKDFAEEESSDELERM